MSEHSYPVDTGLIWCDKHAKFFERRKTKVLQTYCTRALINVVLKEPDFVEKVGRKAPIERVLEALSEIAPLCCHVDAQKLFSIEMVTSMKLRGVLYLSKEQEAYVKQVQNSRRVSGGSKARQGKIPPKASQRETRTRR